MRRWRSWWAQHSTGTKATVISTVIGAVTLAITLPSAAKGLFGPERPSPSSAPATADAVASGNTMPLPTCATCTSGKTFQEEANAGAGATTFRDPRTFRGRGPRVERLQKVQVVCRFHDPAAPASVQPGWWYLLASPPWNRQYYSPANSFLNGDPVEGPHITNVNSGIPEC